MAETFPTVKWSRDSRPSIDVSTRVIRTDFGDGYAQRMALGINNIEKTINCTTDVLTDDQADVIEAFLEARGGWDAFYFRPPGMSEARLFTAPSWKREGIKDLPLDQQEAESMSRITTGYCQISITFKLEHDL